MKKRRKIQMQRKPALKEDGHRLTAEGRKMVRYAESLLREGLLVEDATQIAVAAFMPMHEIRIDAFRSITMVVAQFLRAGLDAQQNFTPDDLTLDKAKIDDGLTQLTEVGFFVEQIVDGEKVYERTDLERRYSKAMHSLTPKESMAVFGHVLRLIREQGQTPEQAWKMVMGY